MEKLPNETVIIVHGTRAAPERDRRKWYEPTDGRPGSESFTAELDAALQERGSPARCWAHCTQGNPAFHWSGDNQWIARTHASSALAAYVAKLQSEGWRCHIIAHSHGGNVMREALPQITAPGSEKLQGKLVTLGTPFLDTMSPILQGAARRRWFLTIVSWLVFTLLAILAAAYLREWNGPMHTLDPWDYIMGGFDIIFVTSVLLLSVRQLRNPRSAVEQTSNTTGQIQPQLLVIGSLVDEAWQILHYLRSADNPMANKSNPFAYLFFSLLSNSSQRAVVARINGAKSYRDLGKFGKRLLIFMYSLSLLVVSMAYGLRNDPQLREFILPLLGMGLGFVFALVVFFAWLLRETFFSAFWFPFRWCVRQLGVLAGVFPAMVTYGVRHSGWSVLQKMSMGLESYQFKIPLVEQYPSALAKEFVKYENMPSGAEKRALDKRGDWIGRHLDDVSQTFSKLVVTTADLKLLQTEVERDQTLVHAAYYTDEECIARVADWIAGRG